MKKRFIYFIALAIITGVSNVQASYADNQQPMVTIEIPASSVDKIDVKYEKEKESKTNKAIEATKDFTDKTVKATKKGYHKSFVASTDLIQSQGAFLQAWIPSYRNAAEAFSWV